ncbi:deoxyribonuclease I, partial [Klebsiella pneumoniae]
MHPAPSFATLRARFDTELTMSRMHVLAVAVL